MITSGELRDSFKYLFPDELPFLKGLVASLPDNPVVVNIGAGAGTSTLAMLEARPDSVVHSVDIQDEDSPLGCLAAERDAIRRAGIAGRSTQYVGDSKEVGADWDIVVDMVFIDGDHSYEGCMGDITVWLPHIKLGGILAIHDYNKEKAIESLEYNGSTMPHWKEWNGVNDAVDELIVSSEKHGVRHVKTVDSLIAFKVVGNGK